MIKRTSAILIGLMLLVPIVVLMAYIAVSNRAVAGVATVEFPESDVRYQFVLEPVGIVSGNNGQIIEDFFSELTGLIQFDVDYQSASISTLGTDFTFGQFTPANIDVLFHRPNFQDNNILQNALEINADYVIDATNPAIYVTDAHASANSSDVMTFQITEGFGCNCEAPDIGDFSLANGTLAFVGPDNVLESAAPPLPFNIDAFSINKAFTLNYRKEGVNEDFSQRFSVVSASSVFLPLPTIPLNGALDFNFPVAPGRLEYLDPLISVGYDYDIGSGDPRFASVLLPNIGDGFYELWLFDAVGVAYNSGFSIEAGVEFDFLSQIDPLGLSRFRILGIETSAQLDPDNPTAFVTGVTFSSSGFFTGTMTPITEEIQIPEPSSALSFAIGPLLLVWKVAKSRRKRAIN